ncbi:sialidase family protein, partial [Singulisphaera rosea]
MTHIDAKGKLGRAASSAPSRVVLSSGTMQASGGSEVPMLSSRTAGTLGLCGLWVGIALGIGAVAVGGEPPKVVKHVVVYSEEGRFAGWPANHGIWIWGNEILTGFSRGTHKDRGNFHNIDLEKPEEMLLARSLDGGLTWSVEEPKPRGMLVGTRNVRHGTMPPGVEEERPVDFQGKIDFTHPNLAFTVRMENKDAGTSRFFYSYDRGRSWQGPFRLPLFGQKGVMARTDYVVNGPEDCTLFLTASKSNGLEGRPFCARTTDGGKTWRFLSFIGPEPIGYSIMPSTVRTSPTDLVSAIRRLDPPKSWIEAYASHDDGLSWSPLSTPEPDAGEG